MQTRNTVRPMIALLAAALIAGLGYFSGRSHADNHKSPRYFEMRIYTAAEGKMEALHARFRDHTGRLFEKHGMDLVGFWIPNKGPDVGKKIYYILGYKSEEARGEAWKGFLNDPEWKKVYAESIKDGQLVAGVESVFLSPTDYSAIK